MSAPPSPGHQPAGPDPEQVLAQALHAMAGGGKAARPTPETRAPDARTRLTTTQVLLLAILLGLAVGVTAGLVSLLI